MKNCEESKRVGKLVRAKAQQCYANAMRVVMEVPEYASADYVEGMAVSDGLPIEHGWVEVDGVILDPTLPTKQIEYFPGLRFRGGLELAKALHIPKARWMKDLPIFYRFGWGGIESPEFRAAIVAAYRHLGWEETAIRYETYEPAYATDVMPDGRKVLVIGKPSNSLQSPVCNQLGGMAV